jgi:tetraacyldisaccharide 4'-kinase
VLDLLYSQLARARRRYYQHRPHLRHRLAAPVISVGNLTVGGSSKTPLAAAIARMLIVMGERPSILSRGYARTIVEEGAVVVSDGTLVLTGVERSGDEPQMLARTVPGAAVLVSSRRYVAGRLAETRLGCTVHVLDDGFQHFDLMRDIDLLVAPDVSNGARTLPFGRLREPLDAAAAADALLVESATQDVNPASPPHDRAKALCHQTTFSFTRRITGPAPDRPAFAFAGIAKPERFFADLEKAGWTLTGRQAFRDHHHYSVSDIEAIEKGALSSGAAVILTTEKDFVRLGSGTTPPIVAVPLEVSIDPSFRPWLVERLHAARARRGA